VGADSGMTDKGAGVSTDASGVSGTSGAMDAMTTGAGSAATGVGATGLGAAIEVGAETAGVGVAESELSFKSRKKFSFSEPPKSLLNMV